MVSAISVFQRTLMFIDPTQLFHNFQNVEWFVQRLMNCNYDVERILTTLNDLCHVEWFALIWIICTCNVECVSTTLKDLHCFWVIWTVQLNFLLRNTSLNVVSDFSLPRKSKKCTLPRKKAPLVEITSVIIILQEMKK